MRSKTHQYDLDKWRTEIDGILAHAAKAPKSN